MDTILKNQKLADKHLMEMRFPESPSNLYDPIAYVIAIGGKRIRPALCLSACEFWSGSGEKALPAALSLEIFHNFTLLHDDIMDHAPVRRNQPTVHEKWNQNAAILSGDAMMILASQMMLKASKTSTSRIQDLFYQTALEVCEGQQYDMDFETTRHVTVDQYLNMIRLKTAVLIAASLKIGALIGGADEMDASLIYDFGENIGMAFQLQDDYLDTFGDSALFGKTIGGDIVSNKKTFLLISSLEKANPKQLKRLTHWLDQTEFQPNEKISEVIAIYKELNLIKHSNEIMSRFFDKAMKSLEKTNLSNEHKKTLIDFSNQLMLRVK